MPPKSPVIKMLTNLDNPTVQDLSEAINPNTGKRYTAAEIEQMQATAASILASTKDMEFVDLDPPIKH